MPKPTGSSLVHMKDALKGKKSLVPSPEQKKLLPLLSVAALILSLFVGLFLVKQRQLLERKARVTGVDLSLISSKATLEPLEEFTVDVFMNTNEFTVSAAEIHISFDPTYLQALSIEETGYLPVVLPPGAQIEPGKASIILGSQPGDPKKAAAAVAKVNFKALTSSPNPVEISFDSSTQVAAIEELTDVTKSLTSTSVEITEIGKPSGQAGIRLTPELATINTGGVLPVTLEFRTGDNPVNAQAISSVTARITFPYEQGSPSLEVVDANGNLADKIFPAPTILDVAEWNFPVNNVSRSLSQITIDFAAVNTNINGFTSPSFTPLATIYLKGLKVPSNNPIELTFDMSETKILTKHRPLTNILTFANGGKYEVQGGLSTLTFAFKMQGVGSVCQDRIVDLFVEGAVNKIYKVKVSSDENGIFRVKVPVPLTDLSVPKDGGDYQVFVKGLSHLRKRLGQITLFNRDNIAPPIWETAVMKAGDFDISGSQGYNILDITDVGKILSVYKQLSVPVTSSNRVYDVDCNGVINITDIALVLTNYTQLQVIGD